MNIKTTSDSNRWLEGFKPSKILHIKRHKHSLKPPQGRRTWWECTCQARFKRKGWAINHVHSN